MDIVTYLSSQQLPLDIYNAVIGYLVGETLKFSIGVIEKGFKSIRGYGWEEIYIQAFRKAVKESDYLNEFTTGGRVDFYEEIFRNEVLRQKLAINVTEKSATELTNKQFLETVANAIAKSNVLVLADPKKQLSELDYYQLTFNFVQAANGIFWNEIKKDPKFFKDEILKELRLGQEKLDDISKQLDEFESNSKRQIEGLNVSLDKLIEISKRGAGFSTLCISCYDESLLGYAYILESIFERYEYRVVKLNQHFRPRAVLEKEIRECEVFVGLYSGNLHNEKSETDQKLAKDYFRRCFFFAASEQLSLRLHPKPQKNTSNIDNFQKGDFDKREFVDNAPWLQRRFELLMLTTFGRPDPIFERQNTHDKSESERVHKNINRKRKADCHERALQIQYERDIEKYHESVNEQYRFLAELQRYYKLTPFDINFDAQAEDLAKLLTDPDSPKWYGLSYQDINECWGELSEKRAEKLQNTILDCKELLQSPLLPLWEAFLDQSWLNEVRTSIQALQEAAQPLRKHSETKLQIESVMISPDEKSFSKNWDDIPPTLLQNWCSEKQIEEIKNSLEILINKQKNRDAAFAELISTHLNQWGDASQRYLSQLKRPRYGRCFLVMGRSGSGKTHFIANLLNEQSLQNKRKYHCIYLDEITDLNDTNQTIWGNTFEGLLLAQATLEKEFGGQKKWKDFSELVGFLTQSNNQEKSRGKIVVILDDLATWLKRQKNAELFLENLNWFIASHTSIESLVWVITLNEANYAYIANENKFWDRYSSHFLGQSWISLDDLNEQGFVNETVHISIGENRAAKNILTSKGYDPAQVLSKLNKESLSLLSIPFVTRVAVDYILKPDEIEELINLHYIDFVEKLFENRSLKVSKGQTLKKDLDTVVKEISDILIYSADEIEKPEADGSSYSIVVREEQNSYDSVYKKFFIYGMVKRLIEKHSNTTRLGEINVTKYLFETLEEKGFLRKPVDNRQDYILELDTKPYWEYQAAISFRDRVIDKNISYVDEINRLFGANGIAKGYDGIFEFFLLLVDKQENIEFSRLVEFIEFTFKHMPSLKPLIWIGASKASGEYQHEFIKWLEKQRLQFQNKDDLQGFLYFLRYALTPPTKGAKIGVSWNLRLDLIARYFKEIKELGLINYFTRYILGGMKKAIKNGEDFITALAHLRGIENQVEPEDVLREMVNIPYVDLESYPLDVRSKWTYIGAWGFETLLDYLPQMDDWQLLNAWMDRLIEEIIFVRKSVSNPAPVSYKEKNRIWIGIIEHYYDAVTSSKGAETLQWLADTYWSVWEKETTGFTGVFEKEVYDRTQETLTIWMGRLWRMSSNSQRQNILHEIEGFLKSTKEVRKSQRTELQKRKAGFQEITVALVIYHSKARNKKSSPTDVDSQLQETFLSIKKDCDESPDQIIRQTWNILWERIESGYRKENPESGYEG